MKEVDNQQEVHGLRGEGPDLTALIEAAEVSLRKAARWERSGRLGGSIAGRRIAAYKRRSALEKTEQIRERLMPARNHHPGGEAPAYSYEILRLLDEAAALMRRSEDEAAARHLGRARQLLEECG